MVRMGPLLPLGEAGRSEPGSLGRSARLGLVLELAFAHPFPQGSRQGMNDHRSGADPSDEFPKFAAWPKVSPGFQAMLKASSDAAVRPVFAELSKTLLGAGLSKPYLGEFSKLAVGPKVSPGFQAMLKASSDAAVRPVFAELSAGMQAVLQAHTQAVARPVFAELSKKLLGAGLSKPYLGEVTKLAAWQNMRAAIDVPAGRT